MAKRMAMVKYLGMPMMRCATKKQAKCAECGGVIPAKGEAFRPVLDQRINGIERYHRLCLLCAEFVGTDPKFINQ